MKKAEKLNRKGKTKYYKIVGYLKDYRFNSILVRSFIIILLFLACSFSVIMFTVSNKMNRIMTEEIGNMSENSLIKTRDRIDVVMEEVARISGKLSLNEDIRQFMLPDTEELFGTNQTHITKERIEQYAGVFDYIDSIYVYSNKNKFIVTNEGGGEIKDFEDITWMKNLTEREYEPSRIISRLKNGSYPNLISYMQPIRLTQMQFLGGIIVNVDVDKLEELIVSNIRDLDETLIILDNRNNIIFSTNQSYLRKKIDKIEFYKELDYNHMDGYSIVNDGTENQLVTVTTSDQFQWKYISCVKLSAYDEYSKGISTFYIVQFLACIILSLVAAVGISLYCYQPVSNILNLLKNPAIYRVDETIPGLRQDEAHEIAVNILRNLYSNQQMQEEMKEYTNIINKAQLTALQAQISPHFLYNTLENIRWKAMDICKGDNEVSQIILNLSEMLRTSIESEQQVITIEEEIQNTKPYIEILQLRYEDKLKVIWEVDPSVLLYPIVKVSLQPIIENAVYHGIKPLRTQGIITISVLKAKERLMIKVADNGVGMSKEEVTLLNEDMHRKYILNENHIGLRNVNQRLKLMMGDDAGLEIFSKEHVGTIVTLILPVTRS